VRERAADNLFLEPELLRLSQLALRSHADLPARALARIACAARGQLGADEFASLLQYRIALLALRFDAQLDRADALAQCMDRAFRLRMVIAHGAALGAALH
jgi:hypothetical protein